MNSDWTPLRYGLTGPFLIVEAGRYSGGTGAADAESLEEGCRCRMGTIAPLWMPRPRWPRRRMTRFMRWLGERQRTPVRRTTSELWRWSVEELEQFWAAIWDFCGVRASRPYERVLARGAMPGARWFAGARAELRREHAPARPRPAGDRGAARLGAAPAGGVTWGELSDAVARASPAGCARWASGAAIASPPTCRTSRRRWSRSWRARASARSGRARRRTSARAA